MNNDELNKDVTPGIHPNANEYIRKNFSRQSREIVMKFSVDWYITRASIITVGTSEYQYILIKAPSYLAYLFNIADEIMVVLCEYDTYEPRTYDVFDIICGTLETDRVEKLCGVIVSNDPNINTIINNHNNSKEARLLVPFTFEEISKNRTDRYFFRNRFQNYFYNCDLFAYDDALKTDRFFFGRNQIVIDIINRHLSKQNSGLFGLRKTGKTSIIYDVKRKIIQKKSIGVFVSCQDPAMSNGTWVDAIYYVAQQILEQSDVVDKRIIRDDYKETTASRLFSDVVKRVFSETGNTILIMFDEVEHITFGKASEIKWKDGNESVNFWKAIRSTYQALDSTFTYCIVGTNPICIEYSTICDADNPIFNGVTANYIPGFDVSQTRDMVRKLGRIMGIKFDETIYAKMREDYGGHPFLIRRLCSFIAKQNADRPITIDRTIYNRCREEFNQTQGKYFDMLLEVLYDFYPLEYELLTYLAQGDAETFDYFAKEDYSMVEHLIGYGIIRRTSDDNYDFQMDVIKDYIIRKEKISQKMISKEERWSHLVTRRGNFEIELRLMVKQVLKIAYSVKKMNAKEYVMSKIYNEQNKRRKYATYSYEDLFDSNKCEIYLKSLSTLILGEWELFSEFMDGLTQEQFIHMMDVLNDEGRFDAHAKIPDDDDIVLFDAALNKLMGIIDEYKKRFLN